MPNSINIVVKNDEDIIITVKGYKLSSKNANEILKILFDYLNSKK